jgi:superfamily I DNA/RNA helicase
VIKTTGPLELAGYQQPLGQLELAGIDLRRDALVIGAAASGKTTQLRHLHSAHLASGADSDELLVLTPLRRSAAMLRDLVALDSPRPASRPRAQSLTGFAFELIAASSAEAPKLLTGARQLAIVAQVVNRLDLPPGLPPSVIQLPGFHSQLRDAVSSCQELGLEPSRLNELAAEFDAPEFDYLSGALAEYRELTRDFLDPALMLRSAAKLIDDQQLTFTAALIDDAQELTPAAFELLAALARQLPLQAFGDPDASVLGFRAASAEELVRQFEGFGRVRGTLQRFTLAPRFSAHPPSVATLLAKVAGRISPAAAGTQRKALSQAAAVVPDDAVSAAVFDTPMAEANWLASQLRAGWVAGLPWSEMVVVARTRNQLDQLAAALAARSVPCKILGSQTALRDQFAARGLLELAKFVLEPELVTAVELELLLSSPFAGFDSLSLRRLQRQLRYAESQAGGQRPIAVLLAEACSIETVGLELDSPEGRRISKLAQRVASTRELETNRVTELFQALWSGSKLAEVWRERALSSAELAANANRDLDSILELFAAAQRFEQQFGEATAVEFIDQQLELAVPEDTLAATGQFEAVSLTTAANLSRGYRLVALPRLQDGIWPNLKPRNALFHSGGLVNYLSNRQASPLQTPKSELVDELRMLYRAIGVCRERLLLSAIETAEESPSQFFNLLFAKAPPAQGFEEIFDLRHRVGQLRRELVTGNASAAPMLAALATAGVAGAHPDDWLGLIEFSDSRPLYSPEEQIRVRPSQLAKFEQCPLHWFISAHGGDGTGFEASLGTLLHEAFELTDGSIGELTSYLDSNFVRLDFQAEWVANAQRRRAQRMALALAEYVTGRQRSTELVEAAFEFVVGRTLISGKIDLIEKDRDGNYTVADLKTGAVPTAAQVAEDRQLALYQLAAKTVPLVPGPIIGANIVSIGSGVPKVISQPALEGELEQAITALLTRVETELGEPTITAQVSEHCHSTGAPCQILLTRELGQ